MKVCCGFSLEAILMSTHNIPYQIEKKSSDIIPNTIMSAAMEFFR